jgi:hypothetical protein
MELVQLKSYLKVEDDKSPSGDLWPFTMQDGHCAWVCCNHSLEYHVPALHPLGTVIAPCHESDNNGKVQFSIASSKAAKWLFGLIGNACRVLSAGDWQSFVDIDLELSRHSSKSTPDVASRFNGLESLSVEFGRFSITADGISRGLVSNLEVK